MSALRSVGRRVWRSTVARFAAASLAPVLGLGWFLGVQVRSAIETRTANVYGGMTNAVFTLAADMIVKAEDFEPGRAYPRDRALVVYGLIARLGGDPATVRFRIVGRDGRVVFGNQPADAGTRVPLTSEPFRTALAGTTATRFVRESVEGMPGAGEKVIEMYLPVRLDGHPRVHGAIVASGIDRGLVGQIDADVRRMQATLAVGLAVLWLCLMPIASSVSRRLRRTAQDNEFLALHDTLTGLPNRNLLRDRLDHAIRSTARTGEDVGLLLIDLDGFKEVNDTLGHGNGDHLLVSVARRLKGLVRGRDTVARLGGDEFAIVVPGIEDVSDLALVAQRASHALAEVVALEGIDVSIQASVGGSVYPLHADDADELLRHADIAMYAAKGNGETYVLYSPDIDSHSPARLALAAELRRALEEDAQLELHYQPVASPRTGRVVSVEALVRWTHPTRGRLGPTEFIPMAEQSGVIRLLSSRVLDMAVRQARVWMDRDLDLSVSVNLSASDLRSMKLLDEVRDTLARHQVPPDRLELEVTETAVLANPDTAVQLVAALRALGVRIALDDFGTGYSSLTYLKRLHPDRLKIDRSFVDAMVREPTDAEIVRSLIGLAHSLGIGVTAEGVETLQHWELLDQLACDQVQGYFLARPLAARAATEWLEQHKEGHVVMAAPSSGGLYTA